MLQDKKTNKKKDYIPNNFVTLLYENPQQFFTSSNLSSLSKQTSLIDITNTSIFEHFYMALMQKKKDQIYQNNILPFFKQMKEKLETTLSLAGNSFLHFLCSNKKNTEMFMDLLKGGCISNAVLEIKNKKGDLFFSELLREISVKRHKIKNVETHKEFFKMLISSCAEFYKKVSLYEKCEIFIFVNNCTFIFDKKPEPNTIISQIQALPSNSIFPRALDYLLNLNTLNYNFMNYLIDKNLFEKAQELLNYLNKIINAQEVKDYCWVLPHFYYVLQKGDLNESFAKCKQYYVTIMNMLNSDTTGKLNNKMLSTFRNVYHYLFSNQSKTSLQNIIQLYELINTMLVKENNEFKLDLLSQRKNRRTIPKLCKQIPAVYLLRFYSGVINEQFETFVKSLFESGKDSYILHTVYLKYFIRNNEFEKFKLFHSLLVEYKQINYDHLAHLLKYSHIPIDKSTVPLFKFLLELAASCNEKVTKNIYKNVDFSFVKNNCALFKMQDPSNWLTSDFFKKLNIDNLAKLFLAFEQCSSYSKEDISQLYLHIFSFLQKENAIKFIKNILPYYVKRSNIFDIVNNNMIVLYQLVFPNAVIPPEGENGKKVSEFFDNFPEWNELFLFFVFDLKGEFSLKIKINILSFFFERFNERYYGELFIYMYAYLLLGNKTQQQYEEIFTLLLQYFPKSYQKRYFNLNKKIIQICINHNKENSNKTNEDTEQLTKLLESVFLAFISKNKSHPTRYTKMFKMLQTIYEKEENQLEKIENVVYFCVNPLFFTIDSIKERHHIYQLLFNGIPPIKVDPSLEEATNHLINLYGNLQPKYYWDKNDFLEVFMKSKELCSHFLRVVQNKDKKTILYKLIIELNVNKEEITFFATLPPAIILHLYKDSLSNLIYEEVKINPFTCLLSPYFGNNIKSYASFFRTIMNAAPKEANPYTDVSKYKLTVEDLKFKKKNSQFLYELYNVYNLKNVLKSRFIDNFKLLADNIGKKTFNDFLKTHLTIQDGLIQLIELLVPIKEAPKCILKCFPSILCNLWNEPNMKFFEKYLPVILKYNCLKFVNLEEIIVSLGIHKDSEKLLKNFRYLFLDNKISKAKLQEQQYFFGTCFKFLNNKHNKEYERLGNIIFNKKMRSQSLEFAALIDNVEYYVKLLQSEENDNIFTSVDYASLISTCSFKIIHYFISIISKNYHKVIGCISNSVCLQLSSKPSLFQKFSIPKEKQLEVQMSTYEIAHFQFVHVFKFKNSNAIGILFSNMKHVFYFYSELPIYSSHFSLCTFSGNNFDSDADSNFDSNADSNSASEHEKPAEPKNETPSMTLKSLSLNPFLFLGSSQFDKEIDHFIVTLLALNEPILNEKNKANNISQGCDLLYHNMLCPHFSNNAHIIIPNLTKLINRCGASTLNRFLLQNPTLNESLCQVIVFEIQSKIDNQYKKELTKIYMHDIPALSTFLWNKYNRQLFILIISWIAKYNYFSYFEFDTLFTSLHKSEIMNAEPNQEYETQEQNNKYKMLRMEESNDPLKEKEHIIHTFLKAAFLVPSISIFQTMTKSLFLFVSSDLFRSSGYQISSIIKGNLLAMFIVYSIYINDKQVLRYFISLDKDNEIKNNFHTNQIETYFNNEFPNKDNTNISDNLVVSFVKRNAHLTMMEASIAIGYPDIVNHLMKEVCPLTNENIRDNTLRCIISTKNKKMYTLFRSFFENMNVKFLQVILHVGCQRGNQFVLNYFINEIKVKKKDLFVQSLFTGIPFEYVNNFYNDLSKDEKMEILQENINIAEDSILMLLVLKDYDRILKDYIQMIKNIETDTKEIQRESYLTSLNLKKFKCFFMFLDSHVEIEKGELGYYNSFETMKLLYEFLKTEYENIKDNYSSSTSIIMEQIIIIGDIFFPFFDTEKESNSDNLSFHLIRENIGNVIYHILINPPNPPIENILKFFLKIKQNHFMYTLIYLLITKFKSHINKSSLSALASIKPTHQLKEEYMVYLIHLYETESNQSIIKASKTLPILDLISQYVIPEAVNVKTFPIINHLPKDSSNTLGKDFLKNIEANEWIVIGTVFINENKNGESECAEICKNYINENKNEEKEYAEICRSGEFRLVHFLTNSNNKSKMNNSFTHFQLPSKKEESNNSLEISRLNQSLPIVNYPIVVEDNELETDSFQLLHYHLTSKLAIPGQLNPLLSFYVFEYKKNEVDNVFAFLNTKIFEDFKLFLKNKLQLLFKNKNDNDNNPVSFIEDKQINISDIEKDLMSKVNITQNSKNNKSQITQYYENLYSMNSIIHSLDEEYVNLLETFKFVGMKIRFVYMDKDSSNAKAMYEKGLFDFFQKSFQQYFYKLNASSKKKLDYIIIKFPFCFDKNNVFLPLQINSNLSPNQFLKLLDHVFNRLSLSLRSSYSGYCSYYNIIKNNSSYYFGKPIFQETYESDYCEINSAPSTFIEYIYSHFILKNNSDELKSELKSITEKKLFKSDYQYLIGFFDRQCSFFYMKQYDYFLTSFLNDVISFAKENSTPFKKLFSSEIFTPSLFDIDDIISHLYEGKDKLFEPMLRDIYNPLLLYQNFFEKLFPNFKHILFKFVPLRDFVGSYITKSNVDVSRTNKEDIKDYWVDIRKCLLMHLFSLKVEQSLKRVVWECIEEVNECYRMKSGKERVSKKKKGKEERKVQGKDEEVKEGAVLHEMYEVDELEFELGDTVVQKSVKVNPAKKNEDISPFEFKVKEKKKDGNKVVVWLDLRLKKIDFKGTYKEMVQFYMDRSAG